MPQDRQPRAPGRLWRLRGRSGVGALGVWQNRCGYRRTGVIGQRSRRGCAQSRRGCALHGRRWQHRRFGGFRRFREGGASHPDHPALDRSGLNARSERITSRNRERPPVQRWSPRCPTLVRRKADAWPPRAGHRRQKSYFFPPQPRYLSTAISSAAPAGACRRASRPCPPSSGPRPSPRPRRLPPPQTGAPAGRRRRRVPPPPAA